MKIKRLFLCMMIFIVPIAIISCGSKDKGQNSNEKDDAKVEDDSKKKKAELDIIQVDTNYFPEVRLYFTAEDLNEKNIIEGLTLNDFSIKEDINGEFVERKIEEIKFLDKNESISINMVIDTSASMDGSIDKCKNAASNFLNKLDFSKGDKVSIIEFNDNAHVNNYFTNDKNSLINSINGLSTYGGTALYDALIDGLTQTNLQDGLKCVIGFTDGEDNKSISNADEVIKLSKEFGIPVYIIGFKGDYDTKGLEKIANETNGFYVSIDDMSKLGNIYEDILNKSKKQYMLKYTTDKKEVLDKKIVLNTKSNDYKGELIEKFIVKKPENRVDIKKYNELKGKVENEIKASAKDLKGNYSIAFKDLNQSDTVIKNNKKTVAASTIKIYVMAEAYYQIYRNNLSLTDKLLYTESDKVGGSGNIQGGPLNKEYSIEELLKAMMTTSDNVAANMLIDHLGMSNINERIKALGCVDTELNRKMMDTNAINSGIENYTSVADLSLTLSKIYNGQAISKEVDKRMIALMERNTVKSKIPNKLPKGTKVAHKSGEYTGVENDAGIVTTDKGSYIICVTTDSGNKKNQEGFISGISKKIYDNYIEYKK